MRVLLGHSFYQSKFPSGENEVFEAERLLLLKKDHVVDTFTRHSDELLAKGVIGAVEGGLSTPWNFGSVKRIRQVVEEISPDVVHIHNTFPLLSPGVFYGIGRRAARVLTLHNYRLFCPAAIPMRNGKVCTKCIDKQSVIPSVSYGCYRKSRIATLPLAFSVGLHRFLKTWKNHVDAFIALTEFQRELMIRAGLPHDKVHVKPNFFPGSPSIVSWADRKPYVVFVGRLQEEKGVIDLLQAWRAWGGSAPELRLVGDGKLRKKLESMASGLPVRFLGQVSAAEAQRQIANARLQILPSVWFEGFPMVVREAFAFGTPSAVSDIGPLPSIVEHGKSGIVFQPADPVSLLSQVRATWEMPRLLERLGQGAYDEFIRKYNENSNYKSLMEIYEKAIEVSRNA